MTITLPVHDPSAGETGTPCYTLKLTTGLMEGLKAFAARGSDSSREAFTIDVLSSSLSSSSSSSSSPFFVLHGLSSKALPLQHLDNASAVELYCYEGGDSQGASETAQTDAAAVAEGSEDNWGNAITTAAAAATTPSLQSCSRHPRRLVQVARGLSKLVLREGMISHPYFSTTTVEVGAEAAAAAAAAAAGAALCRRLVESTATTGDHLRSRRSQHIDDESAFRASGDPEEQRLERCVSVAGEKRARCRHQLADGEVVIGESGKKRQATPFRKKRLALPWEKEVGQIFELGSSAAVDAERLEFMLLPGGNSRTKPTTRKSGSNYSSSSSSNGRSRRFESGSNCGGHDLLSASAALRVVLQGKSEQLHSQGRRRHHQAPPSPSSTTTTLAVLLATTHALRTQKWASARRRAAAGKRRYCAIAATSALVARGAARKA